MVRTLPYDDFGIIENGIAHRLQIMCVSCICALDLVVLRAWQQLERMTRLLLYAVSHNKEKF